jgi:CHAD domain-containing protein
MSAFAPRPEPVPTLGLAQKFAVPGVTASTPLGRAAGAIIVHKAAPIFELAEAAASGRDMEAVHDMRVASRRTREALTLFSACYSVASFERWELVVKRVTKSLGRVRDSDVFLEEFRSLVPKAATPAEHVALAWLIGAREGGRSALVKRMRRELAHMDVGDVRDRFEHWARHPRDLPGLHEPVAALAAEAVSARVTALYAHLPIALDEGNSLAQHAMRIDAKKLRYCVETFAPCFGPGFDSLYPVLKEFQDELGEIHDRDVFVDAVREVESACSASDAGVTVEGLEAVVADLQAERAARFAAFSALATLWPETRMREALLSAICGHGEPEGLPGS